MPNAICARRPGWSTGWIDFVPLVRGRERAVSIARASLGLSDVAGARSLIAEAARLVRSSPESPTLRAWINDACSQLEAATRLGGRRPQRSPRPELRVLRMLPTHLSFPAIASQLFVSRTRSRPTFGRCIASWMHRLARRPCRRRPPRVCSTA
jgi:hypothetical protein